MSDDHIGSVFDVKFDTRGKRDVGQRGGEGEDITDGQ